MHQEEHRRIWQLWHKASADRDQTVLLSLYAEDAILESPMIPRVLNQQSGIITGRENIRIFLDEARRQAASAGAPSVPMRWWREDRFFSSGDTLVWEYPGQTPAGDQIDIVEVMTIGGSFIRHHRVYWGWRLATK